LLLACACAEPYPLPEAGDGPARPWLTQCGADHDCATDSECVAGACTIGCGIDSLELCAGLNADAVCDTTLSACVVPCAVSTTCQALGAGYVCEQGRCRAKDD
jgi:hypothetical protein